MSRAPRAGHGPMNTNASYPRRLNRRTVPPQKNSMSSGWATMQRARVIRRSSAPEKSLERRWTLTAWGPVSRGAHGAVPSGAAPSRLASRFPRRGGPRRSSQQALHRSLPESPKRHDRLSAVPRGGSATLLPRRRRLNHRPTWGLARSPSASGATRASAGTPRASRRLAGLTA
jgi:hypothetical protein